MATDSVSRRIELQELLEQILVKMGLEPNVYYQPPPSVSMSYPAIRYSLNTIYEKKADNIKYKRNRNYTITVIDRNPDSIIFEKILDLPYSTFLNSYAAQNLNHWVCDLYF